MRSKPLFAQEYCKGCGRCLDVCTPHCITPGQTIHPLTGLTPVNFNFDTCTSCYLCLDACPEPYTLVRADEAASPAGSKAAGPTHDELLPLPETEILLAKGTYASAIGGILAGCRHFFGYPITPSTEGTELMAKLMPKLDGVFFQTPSEVDTVNMMYGCGAAGLRSMTFTASPGFSLMLEGLSYMIGAEVPGVFVNVMRGGPGLGNIAPEQSDIKLACRGLGHGNTHAIVLAPSTPQEMLDLTRLAFDLSFRYRNPVILLGDGFLGQMTGRVSLPRTMVKPRVPEWAVYGDAAHRNNLITSFYLTEGDLEIRNQGLNEKYDRMKANEQRAEVFRCEDADTLLIACNTPAHMAKGAVDLLRKRGVAAGVFRPITLWPFPINALAPLMKRARRLVVVEASPGQLEDELRLALSHAGIVPPLLTSVRRGGGAVPQTQDIVDRVMALQPVTA